MSSVPWVTPCRKESQEKAVGGWGLVPRGVRPREDFRGDP